MTNECKIEILTGHKLLTFLESSVSIYMDLASDLLLVYSRPAGDANIPHSQEESLGIGKVTFWETNKT